MGDKDGVKGIHSNIGFGPSDRSEQKPLPLRIVCVGDFCAQSTQPAQRPQTIDAHEFDAVMARVAPRLIFECAGHLGGKQLEVDLVLKSIKDFEPARVATQVPPLAAVQEFVRKLDAVQGGEMTPVDFKKDLSAFAAVPALRDMLDDALDRIGGAPAAHAPAPAESKGALDGAIASIFSMVDTGPRKQDSAAIDAAAAAIAGGRRFDLSAPLQNARKLLETQIGEIIHHVQFRALESRWRGLHTLCRNGKAAAIELLHCAEGDAGQAIESELAVPDREGRSTAPVALVLCDIEVNNTPEGNDMLQALGELGQELQAPVVFGLAPVFLGVESMDELAGLDAPANVFAGVKFDKWRSLRGKDASRWLVAALNRFAMRQPWQRARGGVEEKLEGSDGVLWGSPAWLVGAAVARSFENTGWPSNHTGVSDGEIPALAVFDIPGRDEQFPLQAVLPDRHLKDLSRAGLTPLMCQRGHDSAWVLQTPVLHAPSRAEEEGKLNTLAYAMLAARLGASIVHAKARLITGNDTDRTQVKFEQFLDGLLSDTGPGAGASVEIDGDAMRLKLRVGRAILGGVEIELNVPL